MIVMRLMKGLGMKKPTKIQLKFEVSDDDPLKNEIFKKFSELMNLLQKEKKGETQT
jgi:hypothetical protein